MVIGVLPHLEVGLHLPYKTLINLYSKKISQQLATLKLQDLYNHRTVGNVWLKKLHAIPKIYRPKYERWHIHFWLGFCFKIVKHQSKMIKTENKGSSINESPICKLKSLKCQFIEQNFVCT